MNKFLYIQTDKKIEYEKKTTHCSKPFKEDGHCENSQRGNAQVLPFSNVQLETRTTPESRRFKHTHTCKQAFMPTFGGHELLSCLSSNKTKVIQMQISTTIDSVLPKYM